MASPFVPSHKRRFVANKVFTDRERPVTRFLRAFDPPPPADEHRVLVFHGVGGEGKTALAHHLQGLLAKEYAGRAGWAAVNFENVAMRSPAEALLSIRLQLRQTAGLAFPAFDTAFAHWFGKTWPGASVRERHPELFRQPSELSGDAFDVGLEVLKDMDGIVGDTLGEVPGLGLIWKYGNRFHARFREWWARRGKEVLRGIEALQPDQLLDRLPAFLGADLADGIAAMSTGARRPLTIIGDTLEAFHRSEAQQGGGFAFRNDRWLRELVKETPGVLFVLLARDRLCWAEAEPEWAQVIEQRRLGAFAPEDAGVYLLRVPVSEPEVRARMIQGAQGLPFYLELQVDLYEGLRNQGEAPEPDRFGGSEPEILDRFLNHLGPVASRALTVLAHCRRFDESLWLHLGREFMSGLPPFGYGELVHFSFVEELGDGWLGLHALMREALSARTAKGEPVLHEQLQRSLFEWWDERCRPQDVRSVTPAHEMALEESAFYRATFERETFSQWARSRGNSFLEAERLESVQRLWTAALSVDEMTFGHDDVRISHTLNNLGIVYYRLGKFDVALKHQQRALTLEESALGSDHSAVARSLDNLGNTLWKKGLLNESIASHERSLIIKERKLPLDEPQIALTLSNLGIVLEENGNLTAAIARKERALEIFERTLGSDHAEVARVLGSLGVTLRIKGEPEAAMALQKRALEIYEAALGPQHPSVARTLTNIGIILKDNGELDAALARHERALQINEYALGVDHPEVATTLSNLSSIFWLKGELDQALTKLRHALVIKESVFGPDHPETGKTLGNIGIVLKDKGDLDAAIAAQERALAIKESAFGSDHREVAISLFNLAEIEQMLGRTASAREKMQRSLNTLVRQLGADHQYTKTVRKTLEEADAVNVALR